MPDINETQPILIKLATVETKIDSIIEALKQIPPIEERVRGLETSEAKRGEQLDTLSDEVGTLRTANTAWSALNSVAVFVTAYLGFNK
jgi:hypothetical protein